MASTMAPPKDSAPVADWGFARRPFWLASHLFALTVVASFVLLGFWQLDRLDQRRAANEIVETRAFAPPVSVSRALERPPEALEYVAVADTGRYLDPELVRVANRSQAGAAGDWVVGLFETDDGRLLLLNRGFIPRDETAAAPAAPGQVTGWLRESAERGLLGANDTGEGERVPRFDVAAIATRIPDRVVAPVYLQLDGAGDQSGFPTAVPLPELSDGPHLGYAVQWFIFATLGVVVYFLLLRRTARDAGRPGSRVAPIPPQQNSGDPLPEM